MRTNPSILLFATLGFLVTGWATLSHVSAQTPSGNPSASQHAAEPSKPSGGEPVVPDVPRPSDDELRALIVQIAEKIKPSANAMPNGMKNGFVEDEKLILKLASEVLLLRERVEKLERHQRSRNR